MRHNNKGFSLLEMMVVLAIMSILIYPLGTMLIKAMSITAKLNRAIEQSRLVEEHCYKFEAVGSSGSYKVKNGPCTP